jgi:hypothetical protein
MTRNIFQASKEFPFHISVGVVLTDEKGRICCHFHKKENVPFESEGKSDLYMLMRETPEPGEMIEVAVMRGIKEEFGAEGVLKHYLGSIVSHFPLRTSRVLVQKTTLYFHIEKTHIDTSTRDTNDMEAKSEVLWLEPEKLIEFFTEQSKKYGRTDLDESFAIKNYMQYVGK